MAKAWYPMINYEKCAECGTCVDMCARGVYDKQKAPRPVVVYPEGCVQGCKGCGDRCPSGAIEYFGDTANEPADGYGCGCNCGC
jgi:NAD-dependent dihydropyrimidine dehydrogenase PreA subunit